MAITIGYSLAVRPPVAKSDPPIAAARYRFTSAANAAIAITVTTLRLTRFAKNASGGRDRAKGDGDE